MPEPTAADLRRIDDEYADDIVAAATDDVDEWVDSILADLHSEDY